uniref:Uncharacterized protein n=1 Tax=Anopheles minimus TaxID=112268 RepID=A0A182WPF0_9DIPT
MSKERKTIRIIGHDFNQIHSGETRLQ